MSSIRLNNKSLLSLGLNCSQIEHAAQTLRDSMSNSSLQYQNGKLFASNGYSYNQARKIESRCAKNLASVLFGVHKPSISQRNIQALITQNGGITSPTGNRKKKGKGDHLVYQFPGSDVTTCIITNRDPKMVYLLDVVSAFIRLRARGVAECS